MRAKMRVSKYMEVNRRLVQMLKNSFSPLSQPDNYFFEVKKMWLLYIYYKKAKYATMIDFHSVLVYKCPERLTEFLIQKDISLQGVRQREKTIEGKTNITIITTTTIESRNVKVLWKFIKYLKLYILN